MLAHQAVIGADGTRGAKCCICKWPTVFSQFLLGSSIEIWVTEVGDVIQTVNLPAALKKRICFLTAMFDSRSSEANRSVSLFNDRCVQADGPIFTTN